MIKNDYITTGAQRIEEELEKVLDSKKRTQLNLQMTKQLDSVISGKQKPITLSNPIHFVNGIIKDSSVSPEKRRLLYSHLSHYVDVFKETFSFDEHASRRQATSTFTFNHYSSIEEKKALAKVGSRTIFTEETAVF